jgi:hypothetical protein
MHQDKGWSMTGNERWRQPWWRVSVPGEGPANMDRGGAHEHRGDVGVAEPPELFRLKSANDRYIADINSTHLKWNNPLVCRVSARYNHGPTGSQQVYLARRRVYIHRIAHQLLIYNYSNIITNQVRT